DPPRRIRARFPHEILTHAIFIAAPHWYAASALRSGKARLEGAAQDFESPIPPNMILKTTRSAAWSFSV
ncbi:hypothetical protein K8I31_15090, partial [bacterium]|nr:hypothetical protein [bacterium]